MAHSAIFRSDWQCDKDGSKIRGKNRRTESEFAFYVCFFFLFFSLCFITKKIGQMDRKNVVQISPANEETRNVGLKRSYGRAVNEMCFGLFAVELNLSTVFCSRCKLHVYHYSTLHSLNSICACVKALMAVMACSCQTKPVMCKVINLKA